MFDVICWSIEQPTKVIKEKNLSGMWNMSYHFRDYPCEKKKVFWDWKQAEEEFENHDSCISEPFLDEDGDVAYKITYCTLMKYYTDFTEKEIFEITDPKELHSKFWKTGWIELEEIENKNYALIEKDGVWKLDKGEN